MAQPVVIALVCSTSVFIHFATANQKPRNFCIRPVREQRKCRYPKSRDRADSAKYSKMPPVHIKVKRSELKTLEWDILNPDLEVNSMRRTSHT